MPRWMIALGLFLSIVICFGQQVEDMGLSLEQLEDKLFFLLNQERTSQGLNALRFHPQLRDLARAHSRKMKLENKLSHDFPGYDPLAKRALQADLYFSSIGENVASGDTFVMRFFHQRLLASPGHRQNILNRDFTHMGIGIELSGNIYYVTQEFAAIFEPVAQIEVEREMVKRLAEKFGQKVILSPIAATEMQAYCRQLSSLFLQNKSPKEAISDSYGLASIRNVSFVNSEEGFARFVSEVKAAKPLYWSSGITCGRSEKNPGGIYALSLLLFPDLRDALDWSDGLEMIVLKSLNEIRKSNGLLHIGMTAKLAKPAAAITTLFYDSWNPSNLRRLKDKYKSIFVYQTTSLVDIPEDIAQKALNDRRSTSIGIHVLYPLAQGLPGNYFIVAIVGN
jgi:hypothetical protein